MDGSSEDQDMSSELSDSSQTVNRESDQERVSEEPSSARTRWKKEQKQHLDNLLQNAIDLKVIVLDLSRKNLKKVPDELLKIPTLEYLYLEGNDISCLPEDFFHHLLNLKWLDLRNNHLQSLPSAYIGRHQHLRNLLLEGNDLRSLPLELGLVESLNGLNICNNPLEFPPIEIIENGTQTVLAFLREMLDAKSHGKGPPMAGLNSLSINDDENVSSSEEGYFSRHSSGLKDRSQQSSGILRGSRQNSCDFSSVNSDGFGLGGPVPKSASLQQRIGYDELRQEQLRKLQRSSAYTLPEKALANIHSKTGSRHGIVARKVKTNQELRTYNQMPSPEKVQQKFIDEKRLTRLRELKEKQELILQRRKDDNSLKDWRDESKRKQQQKYRKKQMEGKIDFEQPATKAPFAVAKEDMKMPSNEERIAKDVKKKHEKIRALSPNTQMRMEEKRKVREMELENKIRDHMAAMQERRHQPKGTPQEDMMAAKKELEVANKLQQEIAAHKRNLEYRFTAFTGDAIT